MRALLLVLALAAATGTAWAQAVARKQLISSLGAGAGLHSILRTPDSLAASQVPGGTVTFRTAYALGRRFSLGFAFDRIGTVRTGPGAQRIRVQHYALTLSYRPWMGERAFVEASLALGAANAAVDLDGVQVPLVGGSGANALGVRYARLFSGTVGAFAGLEAVGGGRVLLARYDGAPITDSAGNRAGMDWDVQRVVLGLLVRL